MPLTVARFGLRCTDYNGVRVFFSETWSCPNWPAAAPPPSTLATARTFALGLPFGLTSAADYRFMPNYARIIYPLGKPATASNGRPIGGTGQFSTTAPEAAFRLQRVGASGGLGRITFPILNDTAFTDLPRRRHINVSDWQPLLDANFNTWPNTVTISGFVWTNCIWHWRTLTPEPVTTHRVLANPTRIWQRWEGYDWDAREPNDRFWAPDEPRSHIPYPP